MGIAQILPQPADRSTQDRPTPFYGYSSNFNPAVGSLRGMNANLLFHGSPLVPLRLMFRMLRRFVIEVSSCQPPESSIAFALVVSYAS
jgi:hypothetical protein